MKQRPRFDSRFLVGVEQIDREHRHLFEIAGKVYESIGASDAAPSTTAQAVNELLDYTSTHFAGEEALMAAAGYPGIDAHRRQHGHLLSRVRDMEVRAKCGDRCLPVEMNRFLLTWLAEHIQSSDKEFGEFLAAPR